MKPSNCRGCAHYGDMICWRLKVTVRPTQKPPAECPVTLPDPPKHEQSAIPMGDE